MKLHRTVRYNPELFILIPIVNVLFLVLGAVGIYLVLSWAVALATAG